MSIRTTNKFMEIDDSLKHHFSPGVVGIPVLI